MQPSCRHTNKWKYITVWLLYSFLGPSLFIMYIYVALYPSQYSFLEPSHLCRWHTLFSFYPYKFHSGITYLQYALQQTYFWMTANLLTLNSSENWNFLLDSNYKLSKDNSSVITPNTQCATFTQLQETASERGSWYWSHVSIVPRIRAMSPYLITYLYTARPARLVVNQFPALNVKDVYSPWQQWPLPWTAGSVVRRT